MEEGRQMLKEDLIKKASLSDEKIKAAIRNGELKPGDRIPSHDDLCKRWGISRTTIREALNKLESLGILTKYQGRGTYINDITADNMISSSEFGTLLDRAAVLQLLEARKLVETAIVGLSAERRTMEELEVLQQLLEELEEANRENNHVHYSKADHEFHLFISKMSKNPFLEVMMRNISEPLAIQQMEVISLKPEDQKRISDKSQKYHRKIFADIKEGDPQSAKRSMGLHLESVEKFMKKNL
jgi:GntR family transcriptional repressor for pyruvate dehydrogenase complex